MRYTCYGSPEFEKMIDGHMSLIAERVAPIAARFGVKAVVLGGGYGRGEGGVAVDSTGKESLYNDYDFFIVTGRMSWLKKRRLAGAMRELSHELTRQIGIDVDFSPPKTVGQLRRMDFNMMWQELKHGHKVIYGDGNILDNLPDYDIRLMPGCEGVRLMMNRGTGLLLCREKIEQGLDDEDALDFIQRNIYKAWIACGDICLIVAGNYHWSYVERKRRLEKYCAGDKLVANFYAKYCEAIEYKLRPAKPTTGLDEMRERLEMTISDFERFNARILWYWLGCASDAPEIVLPELLAQCGGPENLSLTAVCKNILLNLSIFGPKCLNSRYLMKHPRYRLFSVMPLLLFDKCENAVYTNNILGLKEISQSARRERFFRMWKRFN